MRAMTAFLLIGAVAVVAVLLATVARTSARPTGRRIARRNRRVAGADPYAEQRTPDKLNPGLGGCASGGGG